MYVWQRYGLYTVLWQITDTGFWKYVSRLYSDNAVQIEQWLRSFGVWGV